MAKIYLPSRLRPLVDNQTWVDISADNIETLINTLLSKYPELKPHLIQDGKLNHYTRLFLNKMEAHDFSTNILPTDEVLIIQAMAGG